MAPTNYDPRDQIFYGTSTPTHGMPVLADDTAPMDLDEPTEEPTEEPADDDQVDT